MTSWHESTTYSPSTMEIECFYVDFFLEKSEREGEGRDPRGEARVYQTRPIFSNKTWYSLVHLL